MKNILIYFFSLGILQLSPLAQTSYLIKTYNIKLPIDNIGNLAYVDLGLEEDGGTFDDITFLYSAGFLLSGKNGDSLWVNGQAGSINMSTYLPGNVDSVYYDPRYKLYTLTSSSEPFSDSWLQWKYAVQLGADYYDGNHDGSYNPVDLNENGKWDVSEDKPDILGDFTAWCVYNDVVPFENRRNVKGYPQGIEIRQTVFTFYNSQFPKSPVNNTIFVRYRIINSGKFADIMDSVYFSAWADPDIGLDYGDDLAGCDTTLNSGFVYKVTTDRNFGNNPPAHFISLLQGPYAFIAGETFIDNNSNGLYDEAVDISLDTAYSNRGSILGIQNIIGAKNLNMTSFIHNMKSTTFLDDPKNSVEARNNMLGLKGDGSLINPCNWMSRTFYGGVECSQVNPYYCYSGNPIIPFGWINSINHDQRIFINTGPFTLKKNQAVDIIVAHIAARGTDALNSFEVTRNNSNGIKNFYNSNFIILPTDVENEHEIGQIALNNYHLYQNYPNPFNPSTKISWQSPVSSWQMLKVYDVLGNEVITLVDEYRSAGSYEVEFSAVETRHGMSLPTGVYFYQLKIGYPSAGFLTNHNEQNFVQTKKMIYLK